ncbi:MAG: tRNA pseudouridine(55) synthase TruB [Pseudomonadales bacterium]|nr:tRNA pseudouridine(55) synthase TruB [Candidatus Woesebacteria bacterium]MCB9800712.1 tRNA pseudouridine(55) synthase TruB [Pseudomonadales bacterium]
MSKKAGMLLVDKPSGISSHTVVNWARKAFGVKKIGHTGTLDPLASGLLVLLVSREYTKLQDTYLKQDKEYFVVAELGVVSDTFDRMGRVEQTATYDELALVTQSQIDSALHAFVGESLQTVPAFSAVKIAGEKLYDLARKGNIDTFDLPTRSITLTNIVLHSVMRDGQQKKVFVTFSVGCSSGTYVRSLVQDFGVTLGCGALVSELRRERIGTFCIQDEQTICPVVPKRFHITKKSL